MGVMETVGVATAGILAAQSMLATAVAAPVYAGVMTAAAGGLVYVYQAYRHQLVRNDRTPPSPILWVYRGSKFTPGEVTNAAGTPVCLSHPSNPIPL